MTMQLMINCVTADNIMRCKKDGSEVIQHLKLINPQCYENEILFDVVVDLPFNYTISSRYEGKEELVTVQLSHLGSIELNCKDFREMIIY